MQERRYLNAGGGWSGFTLQSLRVDEDGRLTLARVPGLDAIVGELPPEGATGAEAAGIAGDDDGVIYLSDPAAPAVWRLDPCSGQREPLRCLSEGLVTPCGLLVGPRESLYIADNGAHRILVVHLPTMQLRDVWGAPLCEASPEPSDAPGRFNEPWDLASDGEGAVYVVERAGRRVQKFDRWGQVDITFWHNLLGALEGKGLTLQKPGAISATPGAAGTRLYLLDEGEATGRVLVVDGEGYLQGHWSPEGVQAVGMAASAEAIYVGDAATGRLLQFGLDGARAGSSPDYRGTIAALSIDCAGRVLVHPGSAEGAALLRPGTAFVDEGAFLVSPFDGEQPDRRWYRLRALADPLPRASSVQLFAYTADDDEPVTVDPGAPFAPDDGWQAAPLDQLDVLILSPPGRYLWLGGRLQGDGHSSPALHQLELTYPSSTYLRYLPAIYQEDEALRPLAEQFLGLFESVLGEVEGEIEDLPLLFDPWAAPADWVPWLTGWLQMAEETTPAPDWLGWLTSWLALPLEERWPEATTREAVAEAFALYGQRGTIAGLRRLLQLYAGVEAVITEPAPHSYWALGASSRLGFDTALAPAHPQGAVLDVSATLDSAHLADEGLPLFSEAAHRFTVQVYVNQAGRERTLERVREVLDREKPAHTDYELCAIEPRLRVGFQSRLGVDAVVGGAPPALTLDEGQMLGVGTVLGEGATGDRGRVGHSRIGRHTRLS